MTRDLFSAVQKFATEAYVNFMGEEDAGGVTEAYDEAKYAKLVALKKNSDCTERWKYLTWSTQESTE
ncbi:MAG: hypothetical protein JRN15_16535, partial [Nitrososphaerota archaeon]|nr:hypothetical protein [Nitrososphaerota archaeon]